MAFITSMLALLAAATAAEPPAAEERSEARCAVKQERGVMVPMRDGIRLAADIYRPDAPGKFPVLMVLRYFAEGKRHADFFAPRGYVVALVSCRGRLGSEGTWVPYCNDPQDGYDAQQWLGQQPWSNGRIGTFGISYNAFTQNMVAPLASPFLTCLFPVEGQQTNFGHLYNDGVMQLNVVFEFGLHTKQGGDTQKIFRYDHPHYRRLPLIAAVDDFPNVQHVKDWFQHNRYDDYWKAYGIKEKYPRIRVPAHFMTGWYDNLCHEGWRNFLGFRSQGGSESCRQGTKILVGPWAHGGSYGYAGLLDRQLRWYDYWLKGIANGIDKEPPIRIYVMGAERWRDENEWPLARTQFTKFYFAGQGKANSLRGDGRLQDSAPAADTAPDQFVYDPENPVYTLGGQVSTQFAVRGPMDRRPAQQRDDVLVYTSQPLAEDLEVTGPVSVKLHAASDAPNTDFTATLSDVHPDGRAIHICEGIRGATFRESLENPTPIEPGRIYEYTIDLWETSMVFKAGHRLRVDVSSSNFPRFARNQNTGLPFGTSADVRKAKQAIYHDPRHPSHILLPVIPPAAVGATRIPNQSR
jgi:putative CocE/NonD family hydrolase